MLGATSYTHADQNLPQAKIEPTLKPLADKIEEEISYTHMGYFVMVEGTGKCTRDCPKLFRDVEKKLHLPNEFLDKGEACERAIESVNGIMVRPLLIPDILCQDTIASFIQDGHELTLVSQKDTSSAHR